MTKLTQLENKKGILSINAIVVIILAITMLGLGITFLKNTFTNQSITSQNECEKGNEKYIYDTKPTLRNYYTIEITEPDYSLICKNNTFFSITFSKGIPYALCLYNNITFCHLKTIEDLTCQELEDEFNCWEKLDCKNILKSCDKSCDLYWMIKKGC